MGKVLLAVTNPAGASLTTGNYLLLGGREIALNTEVISQAVARVAGTLSKLGAYYDATGTGRSMRSRVNGANGNQLISPTDTTAGVYQDGSNTDTLTAGDKFDVSLTSTGTPNAYWARMVFEATSGHACFYAKRGQVFSTSGGTGYLALTGVRGATLTTEALAQCKVRAAGTLRYLQAYISGNGSGFSHTIKSRINGANGNSSLTIGAGVTGLIEDTSNTDTIADGDLVNYVINHGADVGGLTAEFIGCWILSSGSNNDLFANITAGTTRSASGTPSYHPFTGTPVSSATEAQASVQHGFDATASKLRIYISANTYSGSATVTLRIAASDATQTFSIGSGVTGWIEDTTHSDAFTANQDVCVSITGGTSGSLTIRTIGITESVATTQQGAAAWTATGTQTTAGKATKAGAAALTATGTLTATGIKVKFGAAAWTAIGTLAADGIVLKLGAASFSGNGTLAALGLRARSGAAALTGNGTLTASATKSGAGAGAWGATGTLAAAGIKTRYGLAAFTATGTQTAAGKKTGRGTAALTATGTLTAAGKLNAKGQAAFTATGTLTGLGGIPKLGAAAWSAIGTLVAEGRRVFIGKSSAVSTSFTGRTAATNTSGFVGKSSAEATAFTGKTSAQS